MFVQRFAAITARNRVGHQFDFGMARENSFMARRM